MYKPKQYCLHDDGKSPRKDSTAAQRGDPVHEITTEDELLTEASRHPSNNKPPQIGNQIAMNMAQGAYVRRRSAHRFAKQIPDRLKGEGLCYEEDKSQHNCKPDPPWSCKPERCQTLSPRSRHPDDNQSGLFVGSSG